MPPTCSVCRSPHRAAVDQAFIARQTFRHIATQFGLSTGALLRHHDEHLPETLAQAAAAAEVARADDLLLQVKALRGKSLQLLQRAEQQGDIRAALAAVREARACIELLLEVEGRIQRAPQLNLWIAPEWVHVRSVLLTVLGPFAEARAAVAGALARVEAPATNGTNGVHG